jgi:KAP family P-loop domain
VETDSGQPRTSEYASFRILVDDPADDPALGFPDYADAFAEIVSLSPPRFAVGIFGSWGSGKTTLMRAIWARIEDRDDVIPVWFNAWRYEREQHLIIPLLDVLREALLDWAEESEAEATTNQTIIRRARRAAAAMGGAARAIAMGISLSAGLPGGLAEARLDLGKVLESSTSEDAVREPVSLYHASFVTMADAVQGFVTAGGRRRGGRPLPNPQRRIIVFIDDLDRCLPLNALAVLESMKLFFDLEGFVFVAGLDQQVIERAIELRYADPREGAADEPRASANGATADRPPGQGPAPSAGSVSGRDYIKKIFQVPFGLPAVDRSLLEELVSKLVEARRLEPAQKRDLTGRILEHLRYFTDESGVNPREIKRLINAYTLQAKLMSLKLPRVDPGAKVDLDTILALQVMAFRPDWERIWRRLEADPDGFVDRLNQGLEQTQGTDTVWVDGEPLPPRLVDYLTTGRAKPLLRNEKLKLYLSSSQASHTSDPLILQAQAAVDDLRRFTRDVNESTDRARLSEVLHARLDPLKSTMSKATWARDLIPMVSRLESDASALAAGEDAPEVAIDQWIDGFRARLDRLDNDLRNLRDRYSLRAT